MTICIICGIDSDFTHDHKPDRSGLDDGPAQPPRKKAAPKPAAVIAEIRARAWVTRRQKHGKFGHR